MEAAALRNTVPRERAGVFFTYVAAVVIAAIVSVSGSVADLPDAARSAPGAIWLVAVLAVLVDFRPFSAPGSRHASAIFPSICATFALLLSSGLGAAVAVQTAAVIVSSARMRHAPWRAAFNAGQYALAFAAAAGVLRLFGVPTLHQGDVLHWHQVVGIVAAAAVWFVVNDGLVTTAIRLRFGGHWWAALTRTLGHEASATAALLLLGPVVVATAYLSPALVPLMLVPLYAVERMARFSLEREERSRRDPLTGLPNRKALYFELSQYTGPERQSPVALLLLDLDRFKQVNDALGHTVGDRLLVEVANRLRACVRPGDFVARLGGDEFAVLAPGVAGAPPARAFADRVARALADPVVLDGLPLDVNAATGIVLSPEHGTDASALLRQAEVAMYDAKARSAVHVLYAPESDHNSPERLELLADLRRALESPGGGGVAFYYQPQVDIESGTVVGVEALLRWHHPQRGSIDPEELIRVAEHTAVMRLLTHRVIDDVVVQLAKWRVHGLSPRASINVSVRDLHSGDLVGLLSSLLAEHQVPASQIQLEITEGAVMADPRRVLVTLHRLDRLGVALSLDDFGTGYSSLQHLRRLPLAEVKIDRSFVLGMAADPDDAAVVRSIIELSRSLGLRVVAEGVEDDRTRRMLAERGCEVAQGWFYARPMPADEFAAWMTRYRPVASRRPVGSRGLTGELSEETPTTHR